MQYSRELHDTKDKEKILKGACYEEKLLTKEWPLE